MRRSKQKRAEKRSLFSRSDRGTDPTPEDDRRDDTTDRAKQRITTNAPKLSHKRTRYPPRQARQRTSHSVCTSLVGEAVPLEPAPPAATSSIAAAVTPRAPRSAFRPATSGDGDDDDTDASPVLTAALELKLSDPLSPLPSTTTFVSVGMDGGLEC